jgi:hypothetical protein
MQVHQAVQDDSNEQLAECNKICMEAACCWQKPNSKSCVDDPRCEGYNDICPEIDHLFLASSQSGQTTASSGSIPPDAPITLPLLCALSSSNGSDGLFADDSEDCRKICFKAECCWNVNAVASCVDEFPDQCDEYYPCTKLL